jgi:hypothetical protein
MAAPDVAELCPRVAALPRCPGSGLPIPATSGRDGNGRVRFGVNDTAAKLACAIAETCGICAGPFDGGPMVFFVIDTFPRNVDPARLLFPDPPSHPECLADAMSLCPVIARPRTPRRSRPGEPKDGWLMITCDGYELGTGRPGSVLFTFRARGITSVRRLTYSADGALTEEAT